MDYRNKTQMRFIIKTINQTAERERERKKRPKKLKNEEEEEEREVFVMREKEVKEKCFYRGAVKGRAINGKASPGC